MDKFQQTFDKLYTTLTDEEKSLLLGDVQSGLFHVIHTYLDTNSDLSLFEQYKTIANLHSNTVNMYQTSWDFQKSIFKELLENNDKLSKPFIDRLAESAEITYLQPTSNMRLCVLKLPTGHEVLGKAQVLDELNDDETIGNKVAYTNAVNELWALCGTIAKLYIG